MTPATNGEGMRMSSSPQRPFRRSRRRAKGWRMKIEEKREGRAVILSIEGRLDHEGSRIFDEHVSRLIEAGELALVVDFHGVDFLASMGLRALIKPYQAL